MIMNQPVHMLSKPELEKQLSELSRQYEDVKGKALSLTWRGASRHHPN